MTIKTNSKCIALCGLSVILAVTTFVDSAEAMKKGSKWKKFKNAPLVEFEVFYEREDGTKVQDSAPDNENLGIFLNAVDFFSESGLENILQNGAEIKFENEDFIQGTFNLRAELNETTNQVTYCFF